MHYSRYFINRAHVSLTDHMYRNLIYGSLTARMYRNLTYGTLASPMDRLPIAIESYVRVHRYHAQQVVRSSFYGALHTTPSYRFTFLLYVK